MPESTPDYLEDIARCERRLKRMHRELEQLKQAASVDFENDVAIRRFNVTLTNAREEWITFRKVFDERDEMLRAMGVKENYDDEWTALFDATKAIILDAETVRAEIEDRARMKDTANATQQAPPTAPNVPPHENPLNVTQTPNSRSHLPVIQIPHFYGDLTKWNNFKDTFKSLIHDEPSLSNVERFHYLLSSLKGDAATHISRFQVDDRSYPLAWEKLLKVYDNPRVLGSLYLQRILESNTKSLKDETARYEAFLANIADSLEGLRSLELEDREEFILSTLALRDLDDDTRRDFELSIKDNKGLPKANDVVNFVRQRVSAIKLAREFSSPSRSPVTTGSRGRDSKFRNAPPSRFSPKYASINLHSSSTSRRESARSSNISFQRSPARNPPPKQFKVRCPFCRSDHPLSKCQGFSNAPSEERVAFVGGWKGCKNCLRDDHSTTKCPSKWTCRHCHEIHHTLIHTKDKTAIKAPSPKVPAIQNPGTSRGQGTSFVGFGSTPRYLPQGTSSVLLGTVQLQMVGDQGRLYTARAILDCGSQHTFISKSLAVKLNLPAQAFNRRIAGLGGATTARPLGMMSVVIRSLRIKKELSTDAIIVDAISPRIPSQDLDPSVYESLADVQLADPTFGISGTIDVLIGADIYPLIITGAPCPSGESGLSLFPTIFGMTVMGRLQHQESLEASVFFVTSPAAVEEQLTWFWELEEPAPVNRSNPDDEACEKHFVHTHSRTVDGRYIVRLPFKTGVTNVGNNRDMVTRRLCSLENKFRKDHILHETYSEFMKEYIGLGHMTATPTPSSYLIPHHGVWQEGPQGRKLRVVFDASCLSTKSSLNDALHAGPKLQAGIANILIRFRTHKIPLCGDLVKMYRQILIHPEDRAFQHIIWRQTPAEPISEYELNTVTYGVKSSAFQALRVVQQLLQDEGSNFPLAAERVSNDMYVDDIVSGTDTVEEAKKLQEELIALFARGGFQLGKWASTLPELIPNATESVQTVSMQPTDDAFLKILGLCWNPKSDTFTYLTSMPPSEQVTKRAILSTIARIFDPLGLLAPITFKTKTVLQDIWKAKLDWDGIITGDLAENWRALTTHWESMSEIHIPRIVCGSYATCRLIGFCDASQKGYAAAVYLRSEDTDRHVKISLIKAKSKVAPLKYVSIARLELCGALLLSQVITSIHVPRPLDDIICFTDSQVVMSWLQTPSFMLKVFEANRTASIIQKVPLASWRHVRSEDNPADLASRGCTPLDLSNNKLWWHGPSWLTLPTKKWLKPDETQVFAGEAVSCPAVENEHKLSVLSILTTRLPSFPAVIRILAYVLRFVKRCKTRTPINTEYLSAQEHKNAELACFRMAQAEHLPKEMFRKSGKIPKSLEHFSPFLDQEGIVRVGGRLNQAGVGYSLKHPILIPQQSTLAKLIVRHIHEQHFHAGPGLTLALTRGRYWIPRAARMIRSCINHCVQCRISRAKPLQPPMAPLPAERFVEGKAFAQVGVDYAGPFTIKDSNRRKAPTTKSYLCIFVCFATKALHLELVSSLTTAAFLACLDRFTARRGVPHCIWSDHGTNFVGASRYLKDLSLFLNANVEVITKGLAMRCINWKFIPPRAPHFGGLWEAGVKSVKRLLTHSTGKQPLTFEEMTTILTRIEGILNSRPLCALTEDAEDFDFLTPGHFLVGESKMVLPESPDTIPSSKVSLLTRWRYVQEHTRALWERWRREYLNTLQQRMKWMKKVPALRVGDLVILIERRSNLGVWPVARVEEVIPGRDGTTRTVIVRSPSGNHLTRAVNSLVPLFYPHEKDSEE